MYMKCRRWIMYNYKKIKGKNNGIIYSYNYAKDIKYEDMIESLKEIGKML